MVILSLLKNYIRSKSVLDSHVGQKIFKKIPQTHVFTVEWQLVVQNFQENAKTFEMGRDSKLNHTIESLTR